MISLPWPDTYLSPNARVHFHDKRRAVKAYREQAFWTAYNARLLAPAGDFVLKITFVPPLPKRKRDLDNMLASFKAGLDGIADAMSVNDERFGLWISKAEPEGQGRVEVTIVQPESWRQAA